jgi:hypothetical protein
MLKHSTNVICIRRDSAISDADQQVADLAFNLWLSLPFRGSPEKALLTAVQMLRGNTSAGLLLMRKRTPNLGSLTAMRHYQAKGDNEEPPRGWDYSPSIFTPLRL